VPDELKPPSAASQLLSWIRDPHLPQILGDLSEEYGERARSLGAAAARRWYWREAIRNAFVLLQRRPALQVSLATIVCLVGVHASMMAAASLAWQRYVSGAAPINVRPVRPWFGWMGWSWGMAWPPASTMPREFYLAIPIGLLFGFVLGRLRRDQVHALRVTAVSCWATLSVWFVIRALFFVAPGPRWHADPLLIVRALVIDFTVREFFCAGSFWVATYLGAASIRQFRSSAVTQ
jgi:hypothetical protein